MDAPEPLHPPRINILGVGVHALNMPLSLKLIDEAIHAKRKGYITVTGVHGIMEAQHDDALRSIFNHSFLTTPDGMPTVWLGRAQGQPDMQRVYGPDLMMELCAASVQKGYRHFLYGGNDGVAGDLQMALEARFPGLQVVGTFTPPFRPLNPEEEADLKAQVSQAQPDICWIGLSTPKQERFMAEYLPKLDVTLMAGVGAAFDIHTGRMKEAPRWMMKCGLQWLQRMMQEPRRLAGRYLVNNPKFVFKSLCQLAKLKKYSLD
jgi:N-acetylglucosaminyldiphosphoundecaprenol N-acetyl-beta-D-mannosaminyltransferase